jgi:ferredoxin
VYEIIWMEVDPAMKSDKPSGALLAFAGVITCLTWPLAAMLWFRLGEKALGISLFGLGLSLGPGLAADCILCQYCAHVCPTGALALTVGLDTA